MQSTALAPPSLPTHSLTGATVPTLNIDHTSGTGLKLQKTVDRYKISLIVQKTGCHNHSLAFRLHSTIVQANGSPVIYPKRKTCPSKIFHKGAQLQGGGLDKSSCVTSAVQIPETWLKEACHWRHHPKMLDLIASHSRIQRYGSWIVSKTPRPTSSSTTHIRYHST